MFERTGLIQVWRKVSGEAYTNITISLGIVMIGNMYRTTIKCNYINGTQGKKKKAPSDTPVSLLKATLVHPSFFQQSTYAYTSTCVREWVSSQPFFVK